jgi:hypothetical protein
MELDPFCLYVKDLVTQSVIARYNSFGPLYTIPLHPFATSAPATMLYALEATTSPSTWHHCLSDYLS